MSEPSSIASIAAELAERHACSERLAIGIGNVQIGVRTNSRPLAAALRGYFGNLVCDVRTASAIEICAYEAPPPDLPGSFRDWPRDGGKQGRKEAFADLTDGRVVQKVRTGMQFLIGSNDLVAVGQCVENANQVINFINSQYVSRRLGEGWELCHAAGVSDRGRGLGICARAGGGKSTLALHLISTGLSFVSNDRLLIRDGSIGPEMAGIPKMPRVNPGTLLNNSDLTGILPLAREAELRELDSGTLWNLEEKYDVMIDSVYGSDRTTFQVPLAALMVLTWSSLSSAPTSFARVNLRERPDLLDLIMKSPGVLHRDGNGRVVSADSNLSRAGYLDHLRDVPVIEATGKANFEQGVVFCRKLLGES